MKVIKLYDESLAEMPKRKQHIFVADTMEKWVIVIWFMEVLKWGYYYTEICAIMLHDLTKLISSDN